MNLCAIRIRILFPAGHLLTPGDPAACRLLSLAMPPVAPADDQQLVERAQAGDEEAFTALVRRHSPALLRLARMYVASTAVAEEVVQETWLAVLKGLERFEGRSSFKTWLFRILVNRAKTKGVREHRSIPFASIGEDSGGDDGDGPSVDPVRFAPDGAWASPPRHWEDDPEAALRSKEARRLVEAAIDELPERQKVVITLRDLEGLSSEEVRNALDLSETNQRVLLHRARTKVRAALEDWIDA
jgi:RNA polymerase sigma-70 factor (ECF subfamily)